MTAWVLAVWLASSQAQSSLPPAPSQQQKAFDAGGRFSVVADALPRRDAIELRPQASLTLDVRLSKSVRLEFDGFAEGLIADRGGLVLDAGLRVRDAWLELAADRVQIRGGYGRLVWGRLDEIQPTDVINPIDASRFLFEGRSAARRGVAFVDAQWFASENLSVQGVLAPAFRRGVFDELDEPSSPFNLVNDVVLPAGIVVTNVRHEEPSVSWSNASGGARMRATAGTVDFAISAYRGFEGFGVSTFEIDESAPQVTPAPAVVGEIVERFPRFTMIGGDFETVNGDWAFRGEAAIFVEKTVAVPSLGTSARARAFDAGFGFDRRSGAFRIFASLLIHREWTLDAINLERSDVSVVGSIERQFSNERYLARVFGVVNPGDASGFLRGLFVWRPMDNVAVESSGAAFIGTGDDALSRFHGRDFVLTRVTYFW